jgi:hypothetical protein
MGELSRLRVGSCEQNGVQRILEIYGKRWKKSIRFRFTPQRPSASTIGSAGPIAATTSTSRYSTCASNLEIDELWVFRFSGLVSRNGDTPRLPRLGSRIGEDQKRNVF